MAVDWLKIKTEYVNGGGSYRKLAEKYGINKDTIAVRAKAEGWTKCRQTQTDKIYTRTLQKTAEKIAEREANRTARMLCLADSLADKLEQAIAELDSHAVTSKHKTRTIQYDDSDAPGKPTKEVIDEKEDIVVVQSLVDRKGLQQVAAALKNVNDIIGANNVDDSDTLKNARKLLEGVDSVI